MPTQPVPSSILILGTGVFGLAAAHSLLKRARFSQTKLTLVSPEARSIPESSIAQTASIDTTRIIRADYADRLYAELGQEAHQQWREGECGRDGRYNEVGLLLTSDESESRGMRYIKKSLENVKQQTPEKIQELQSKEDIERAMRAPGKACGSGDAGYINMGSGWADAEGCMRWLHQQVVELGQGRVSFVQDEAVRLLHDAAGSSIRGAELLSGEKALADLTILATGAWTPKLLDMRGVASSRAQTMAYYELTPDEAEQLSSIPVHLNLGTGRFIFPPTKRRDGGYEIKAARHTFGYSNPLRTPAPLGVPTGEKQFKISLPAAPGTAIPKVDEEPLTAFVHSSLPVMSSQPREPIYTRLCHYLDTPEGDFLICYHPAYRKSLFLTTGGSGHGFKFLPVIGEKIVDVLEEGLESSNESASKWAEKWAWPKTRLEDDEVWCDDGSRSGDKGRNLKDAMSMHIER